MGRISRSIAEGVGCDAAQGFLHGGAVAVERLSSILDRPMGTDPGARSVGLRPVPSAAI